MSESAVSLPASMRVLERGWLSSNNVLFTGTNETALVDSGYVSHAPQTLALVRHALQGRNLDLLVNTHLHSDHCGGNAMLQQSTRCRTLIPAAEADQVRRWDEDALSYRATGQRCPRFSFDGTLDAGTSMLLGDLTWQFLAAPGHDPHSLILYCAEERLLISADALWEHGFGVVFPELDGEAGFAETRATLELIATLDIRLVIPGHGAPFTNVGKALDTAFSRIDYLAADPSRNAQNAVKVLLKFLLLERQQLQLETVASLLLAIPLAQQANTRFLQMPPAALADWCIAQLVKAGAAQISSGMLMNH